MQLNFANHIVLVILNFCNKPWKEHTIVTTRLYKSQPFPFAIIERMKKPCSEEAPPKLLSFESEMHVFRVQKGSTTE